MDDQGGAIPGWYPDPSAPGTQRYWDGSAWTDHTAPIGGGDTTGAVPAYPAGVGSDPLPYVDTWLWQSIVVTVLCCLPLGIVGIVFSSQAQAALSVGNVDEAREKARTARLMCLIGAGVVVGVFVLFLVFFFLGLLSTFTRF